MRWKSDPNKPEKLTPWVFGAFGVIIFLIATYMNYGDSLHWGSATDVSATTAPQPSDR
jgi:hypothetical protein